MKFAFIATCSDALRCAGMRSSGGLKAIFHGDNTGSNPVGDAKTKSLKPYSPLESGTYSSQKCHPAVKMGLVYQLGGGLGNSFRLWIGSSVTTDVNEMTAKSGVSGFRVHFSRRSSSVLTIDVEAAVRAARRGGSANSLI